jgi:uncharacterized membrane protein YeaQ/YmgE (transglycosylase-associated protein family)
MDILTWIILGGIAGWVAKSVTGIGEQRGCLFNIVVGIIGSVLGGMIFRHFGKAGVTGFNGWSLLVAAVGAIVFLAVAGLFRSRR